jgi:hypothetical protein
MLIYKEADFDQSLPFHLTAYPFHSHFTGFRLILDLIDIY